MPVTCSIFSKYESSWSVKHNLNQGCPASKSSGATWVRAMGTRATFPPPFPCLLHVGGILCFSIPCLWVAPISAPVLHCRSPPFILPPALWDVLPPGASVEIKSCRWEGESRLFPCSSSQTNWGSGDWTGTLWGGGHTLTSLFKLKVTKGLNGFFLCEHSQS